MGSALRIAVFGYIVRGPLGGLAWHYLQYVLGLRKLGHDVAYFEDSGDDPWSCYDPVRGVNDSDPSFGIAWANRLFERVGVGSWAYYDSHTKTWLGPMASTALDFCASADIAINVSGSNVLRDWALVIPSRIYVDTDPVFTQVRILKDPQRSARANQHNSFFTFGENIRTGASIPDDGLPWHPTRQPVVLDVWASRPAPPSAAYTTVMHWDSYPAVEHEGRRFGMKSDSFTPYLRLPSRVRVPLELAAGQSAHQPDVERAGWRVADPMRVARDASTFRDYVHASRGEFTVAKHGYVASRSGWFSERSANYLASGRPVITQDTSFRQQIPDGEGLLSFNTFDEAVDAIERVEGAYDAHSRAARELAEEYFDSDKVLARMLDSLGPPGTT